MNFLYPYFLFALSSLSIPIIIHLFNFRKTRKVVFPNVKFLQNIKKQTASKSHLVHLLVLCTRILFIVCLVIAFAQPVFFDTGDAAVTNNVYGIYIDNSFSMDFKNREGSLLKEAKEKAEKLARSAEFDSKFLLVTNNFDPRHNRLADREEFLRFLEEIEISPKFVGVDVVLRRMDDLLDELNKGKNAKVFLISDFTKNTLKPDIKLSADSLRNIFVVPLRASIIANAGVDSLWFTSPVHKPGYTNSLVVKIRNYGKEELNNLPVQLFIDDKEKAAHNIPYVKPSGYVLDTIKFSIDKQGLHTGKLSISDNYLDFDNSLFFVYNIEDTSNVLVINGAHTNKYIEAVFASDNWFRVKKSFENALNYEDINQQMFVVLNEPNNISSRLATELKTYIENGGSLLFVPSLRPFNFLSYDNFLKNIGSGAFGLERNETLNISKVNLRDDLFSDIFDTEPKGVTWPFVKRYLEIKPEHTGRMILALGNGKPILKTYKIGKGNFYLSGIPFDDKNSSFVMHSLFLPIIYKMALLSGNNNLPAYYTIGNFSNIILHYKNIKPGSSRLSGNGIEMIPDISNTRNGLELFTNNIIKTAGIYDFVHEKTLLAKIAFNYDRSESNPDYYSEEELREIFKGSDISVKTSNSYLSIIKKNSMPPWKYFIMMSIIFLMAEVVLLRLKL